METAKNATAKVGEKLAKVAKPTDSKCSRKEDDVKKTDTENESEVHGTHAKEHATSLVSNLEKLGPKPTDGE